MRGGSVFVDFVIAVAYFFVVIFVVSVDASVVVDVCF